MSNELINSDPLDIEDLLTKVEKSFDIKFVDNEFVDVKTFGELSDRIIDKINLENSDSCTTQQAFYKLRKAMLKVTDYGNIKSETLLSELFPKQNRISKIKKLEDNLGFKIGILEPKLILTLLLFLLLLSSFILIFIEWKIGIPCFILSIVGFKIINKFGKEFKLKTVGELTEKITREHYLKSRSNPKTFNRNEVEIMLAKWFSSELILDDLTKESKLG
ncbi:MAG: hypothetical protein H7195_11260 [Chryseobacterium sp.]|nr:hypothetical protein [Chryseobacterium sp.]